MAAAQASGVRKAAMPAAANRAREAAASGTRKTATGLSLVAAAAAMGSTAIWG